MAIKDILMVIDPGPDGQHIEGFSLSLAQQTGAHLTAIGYAAQIIAPVSFVGDYPYDLMVQATEEARAAAESAYERLKTAAPADVQTEFRMLEGLSGELQNAIGRAARTFDMTIVRQSPPQELDFSNQVLLSTLFSSGRPAFVVPYIHRGPARLERVMVAWDGGTVAARAVAAALPLLSLAKSVEVVTIASTTEDDKLPAFDITRHLARHGVNAELKHLAPGSSNAATLLSHAADMNADYMVMGCYGHSRLLEFIIGGTTREVLESMTVPILMAH